MPTADQTCPRLRGTAACAVAALAVMSILGGCRSPEPAPVPAAPVRREHPPDVARAVSPTRSFDHRPYEFIWDPRPAPRVPLIDFDLVVDWTARGDEGVEVAFRRSQDEQLWGGYTGRIDYRAPDHAGAGLRVELPEPLRIPGRFDSVDLWVFGPRSGCGNLPGRGGPALTLMVRGAGGQAYRIPMGQLNWGGWGLVHRRLPPEQLETMMHPVDFEGFLLHDLPPGQEAAVYLDGLSFYVEPLAPLRVEPRPAPNLEPWPGLSPGLHTRAPPLPFPVDDRTVIPPASETNLRTRVEAVDRHVYDFICEGEGGTLRYRLDLNDLAQAIAIFWNDAEVGHLVDGGRVLGRRPVLGRLLLSRLEDGWVRVEFEAGAVYRFGLVGRSLVVDMYSRSVDAEGFSLGRYLGPLRFTALAIPGLDDGTNSWVVTGVLTADGKVDPPPLFISTALDWYRSEASRVQLAVATNGTPMVRTVYRPGTQGERNDLFERGVLTVSPRLEDTLPRPAQPPARRAGALRERIWADPPASEDYAAILKESRGLAALGLVDVIQGHRETCWRDGDESCTLRWRAAPRRGGDEALAAFVRDQQGLGWLAGLPAAYLEMHALSPFWSPDRVRRLPDGNWGRGPRGHHGVKAVVGPVLQARVAPAVAGKFGPALGYLRDVAAHPPWVYTDYDARVPGAGRFTQAYYSAGELLLREAELLDAPLVCEGGAETFYAGLADGYVAAPSARGPRPYLPVFYLERVNPLACGFGCGPADPAAWSDDDADASADAWIADQIAYGRAGRLVPAEAGTNRRCRSYYMMRHLQPRYLLRAPRRIAYWDGRAMVSTSAAITGGALARSQLYLNYPGDLEIWVNGHDREVWEVRVGRDTWRLPPSGWVAAAPGFLEVSVLSDGRRIDYLAADGFSYFDGRGDERPFRGWSAAGPVVARSGHDVETPVLDVLDLGGTGRFSAPLDGRVPVQIAVLDQQRRPAGIARFQADGERVRVEGPAGPHHYLIELGPPPPEPVGPGPEKIIRNAEIPKT